jgi:hypothetical protein
MVESLYDKRVRALKMIIASLRMVDKYNLEHDDAKVIDDVKFEYEIMKEFNVSQETASKYLKEAMAMNEVSHNDSEHTEYLIRSAKDPTLKDSVETAKKRIKEK